MTAIAYWLVPLVGLVGGLVGARTGSLAGALAGVAIGGGVGWFLWRVEVARARVVTRRVIRSLDRPQAASVEARGGPHWRQLGRAINALAADRRELLDQLQRNAPWRQRFVASIHAPALLFSADDHLVAVNDAARRLLGLPPEEGDLTLIQALGSVALAHAAREARATGGPVQVDAEVRGRELQASVSVVGDELLLLMTDRTEQRRVEELRRDFVVNASHELKTPVAAIQTLGEALEVAVTHGSPRVPDLVARLQEESQRLVRIVGDLLDLRRLEEPGPLELVAVDLCELVRSAAAELQRRAEERGIVLRLDLPDQAVVAGVAADLRLVIANLLANAVQYNRDGGRVEVTIVPDDGAYLISVRDTGIGIPQHDLQRIFERFYRVDVARSRERGGTGLGLSIVRHAVERHGGSVRVDSLLGEGSTFTVRLPIEPGGA